MAWFQVCLAQAFSARAVRRTTVVWLCTPQAGKRMHRSDIAHATGRGMHLTPDHEAVLIADVVQEWADRHTASPTR